MKTLLLFVVLIGFGACAVTPAKIDFEALEKIDPDLKPYLPPDHKPKK